MLRFLRPVLPFAAVLLLGGCLSQQPPELPLVGAAQTTQAKDACTAKGGNYAGDVGKFGRVCVRRTRDAGKYCTKSSQCQGACLARSNTCAPITPLLGCQDILTDSALRMTQCIN